MRNGLPQEHQELSKHSHVCQFFAGFYHDMDYKQLQQRLPLLWFDRLLRRFGPLLPLPVVALRAASDLVMLHSEQHQLSGLQSGRLQGHYTETAVIYVGLTVVRLLVYFLHCAGMSCSSFPAVILSCCILSPYGCVELPQMCSNPSMRIVCRTCFKSWCRQLHCWRRGVLAAIEDRGGVSCAHPTHVRPHFLGSFGGGHPVSRDCAAACERAFAEEASACPAAGHIRWAAPACLLSMYISGQTTSFLGPQWRPSCQ